MDKQSANKLLDETFNSDFEINRFIRFVKELFNNFTVRQKECTKYIASQYKDYISSFDKIGDYENARKSMEVLVVQLNKTSSRDRARTMQRNFIANWLGKTEKDAALVAFYGDDPQDWRFSFVKMEYRLAEVEPGKIKAVKELTPAKRYSFLVGVNEPNHTCRRQFLELVQQEDFNPTLEEIEKAFSIDNVTKEFFLEYKERYLGLKESLGKVIEQDPYVKREFEEKDISTVDFAKKLLGQIVFIYFLQKKGWLGVGKDETGRFKSWGTGPKDFLRKLFDKEIVSYDNFFNEILEPLFYDALANPRENEDGYYIHFNCKIPFLNGGLFDPINNYDWSNTDIIIPNELFSNDFVNKEGDIGTGILDMFDRYNFTIKEDEPLEKEVAIDPEMLGKVFENLLDIKDRKSTGRYYTPREIVHYMCQQSLINYLATNSPISIPRDDIEKCIQLGDFALDLTIRAQEQKRQYHGKTFKIDESLAIPKPIEDNYKEIDKRLKEIKIVDPAVGSGAFPIGMMNEIVKARSLLTIFFDEDEQKKRTVYNFKRETIENCLYGVDIDSSAVDIAKLRFWLSLIVDEEEIKNIKPLPNLDHKIMCGNSLLEEFEGVKLFDEKLLIELPKDYSYQLEQIDREVNKLNQEFHDIHTGKKADNGRTKQIQREIKNLKKKKQEILSGPNEDVPQVTLDEAMQKRIRESQKKLNELKNLQKKFFNEQNRKIKKQYAEEIGRIEWELIEETLREEGNEEALQKLQQNQKNKAKPFFLWKLYFSEIFQRENPGFDVVIANPPYGNLFSTDEKKILKRLYPELQFKIDAYSIFILRGIMLLKNSGYMSYIIPSTFMDNYFEENVRFKLLNENKINLIIELDDNIFEQAVVHSMILGIQKGNKKDSYDIRTSYSTDLYSVKEEISSVFFKNQFKYVFSIRTYKMRDFFKKLKNNSTSLEKVIDIRQAIKSGNDKKYILSEKKDDTYKPILGGKHIKKWKVVNPHLFLKYGKHLACPRDNTIFEQPKILIREAGKTITATYDDTNYYIMSSLYNAILIDRNYDLKYILALLNSEIFQYLMNLQTFEKTKGAFTKAKIFHYYKLPIKKASLTEQKPIIQLVDQILSITKEEDYLDNTDKQAKVKRLENEIGQLVYELYELTPEEIKLVEEFNREK